MKQKYTTAFHTKLPIFKPPYLRLCLSHIKVYYLSVQSVFLCRCCIFPIFSSTLIFIIIGIFKTLVLTISRLACQPSDAYKYPKGIGRFPLIEHLLYMLMSWYTRHVLVHVPLPRFEYVCIVREMYLFTTARLSLPVCVCVCVVIVCRMRGVYPKVIARRHMPMIDYIHNKNIVCIRLMSK